MIEEYMKVEFRHNIDSVEVGDVYSIVEKEEKWIVDRIFVSNKDIVVLVTRKGKHLSYVPLKRVSETNNEIILDLINGQYTPLYALETMVEEDSLLNSIKFRIGNIGKDKLEMVLKGDLKFLGFITK